MKILIYGSVNIDSIYKVQDIVKPGQTIKGSFEGKKAGGKGANQAFAVGMACNNRYEVYFAGKADYEADFIFNKMKEVSINCDYVCKSSYGTGSAIIQVSQEGQNSIIVCSNGNYHIEKDEIDNVFSNFEKGDCLILNAEINNVPYILEKSYEKGMIIFFNPSPCDQKLVYMPLEKASYLIFNEIEGSFFSGVKGSYKEIVDSLKKKYPNSKIVLTMGKDGCYCDDIYVPAYKVNAVDTTGCGDTFLGFFATEIISGNSIENSLKIANKAASIAATRLGAMTSIPSYSEVVLG